MCFFTNKHNLIPFWKNVHAMQFLFNDEANYANIWFKLKTTLEIAWCILHHVSTKYLNIVCMSSDGWMSFINLLSKFIDITHISCDDKTISIKSLSNFIDVVHISCENGMNSKISLSNTVEVRNCSAHITTCEHEVSEHHIHAVW